MVDLVFLESNQQRCCLQNSLFARSDVGILGKTRSSSKTKKKTSSNEKIKSQKYTIKQQNKKNKS